MTEYHKINTIYKRDMERTRRLIEGEWARDEFRFLADNEWQWTEKVDGTNVRIIWDGTTLLFGGRTDAAQMPVTLTRRLGDIFDAGKMADKFGAAEAGGYAPVTLYGEGYGAKIQKVGALYIPDRVDFVLFDVNVGGWWLDRDGVANVADYFGVQSVPVVGTGSLGEAVEYVKSGPASRWGNFPAEGIVLRPMTELRDRGGHRIIAKLKHRDFEASAP